MDCFIINNITENDTSSYKLRILTANKPYFPIPDDETPQTYDIKIKVGPATFDRQYRYKKNKSGILKFRGELYRDILKIEPDDVVSNTLGFIISSLKNLIS